LRLGPLQKVQERTKRWRTIVSFKLTLSSVLLSVSLMVGCSMLDQLSGNHSNPTATPSPTPTTTPSPSPTPTPSPSPTPTSSPTPTPTPRPTPTPTPTP